MTHQHITIDLSPEVLTHWPTLEVVVMTVQAGRYTTDEGQAAADRLLAGVRDAHGDADRLRAKGGDEAYREFYRSMGLKAAQVSNPLKQAARVLTRGEYRPISPVVDICMDIEYRTLASFQVYDAAKLADRVSYAIAKGDESIDPGREVEAKMCKSGELILRHSDSAVHSCYYGNDVHFALQGDGAVALVRIMRVPGFPDDFFERAVDEARARLQPLSEARLGINEPTAELLYAMAGPTSLAAGTSQG